MISTTARTTNITTQRSTPYHVAAWICHVDIPVEREPHLTRNLNSVAPPNILVHRVIDSYEPRHEPAESRKANGCQPSVNLLSLGDVHRKWDSHCFAQWNNLLAKFRNAATSVFVFHMILVACVKRPSLLCYVNAQILRAENHRLKHHCECLACIMICCNDFLALFSRNQLLVTTRMPQIPSRKLTFHARLEKR